MPELPEVQTVVDGLNRAGIPGRRITGARVYWPKTIAEMTPADFCHTIRDRMIRHISRRGKYIVIALSGTLTLLIHLRMSGRLNWKPARQPRNKHEHVILKLGSAHDLRFQDTRKFGRIWLTANPHTVLDRLGPEPLEATFTRAWLKKMLTSRRRQIKPLLLDQQILAGLGNIYVDEALWSAGIHPLRISHSLSHREITALHRAIPRVLKQGLENMGTSLGSGQTNFIFEGNRMGNNALQLNVFRRTGQDCPRCGASITRIVVAQRSSHVCPDCQPLPS